MNQEKHIAEKVGRRIRRFRESAGMSQMELAAEARIDKGYLGEIERGRANVSIRLVARIADTLKVDIAEFFTNRRKA